jgi:hypothetical protein
MEKKKISRKKDDRVKIIGSKSLDYTFIDNDSSNLKFTTNISHKKDEDNSNNVPPKESKINKDISTWMSKRFTDKSRYKGRITGGQSKQSHSSVYE